MVMMVLMVRMMVMMVLMVMNLMRMRVIATVLSRRWESLMVDNSTKFS